MDNTNTELFAQLRKQFKQYRLFKPIWVQRCTKHQDVLTKNGYLSLYPGLYAFKTNNKEQDFDVMVEEKLTAYYKPSNITDGPWKRYNARQDAPGVSAVRTKTPVLVQTIEGSQHSNIGDFIVVDHNGLVRLMPGTEFKQRYQPVLDQRTIEMAGSFLMRSETPETQLVSATPEDPKVTEQRAAEAKRVAAERAREEEKKRNEEKARAEQRKAEDERVRAELKRQQELKKQEETQRLAEETKRKEDEARKAAEQKRVDEHKRAAEEAKKQEEATLSEQKRVEEQKRQGATPLPSTVTDNVANQNTSGSRGSAEWKREEIKRRLAEKKKEESQGNKRDEEFRLMSLERDKQDEQRLAELKKEEEARVKREEELRARDKKGAEEQKQREREYDERREREKLEEQARAAQRKREEEERSEQAQKLAAKRDQEQREREAKQRDEELKRLEREEAEAQQVRAKKAEEAKKQAALQLEEEERRKEAEWKRMQEAKKQEEAKAAESTKPAYGGVVLKSSGGVPKKEELPVTGPGQVDFRSVLKKNKK